MERETLQVEAGAVSIPDRPFVVPAHMNVVGRSILKYVVTLARDEDDFIVASCPALPGCHSQGRSREEAIANIREAIRGYIASMRKHGERIPAADVEEVEVAI